MYIYPFICQQTLRLFLTSCLQRVEPHWTWDFSYLFELMILFPSDVYPEVGLLDPFVIFLITWGTAILFSSGAVPVYTFHHQCPTIPSFVPPCQHLSPASLITEILTGVRWHLVVWFAFPWCIVMLSMYFHLPVGHLYISFGKMSA